MDDGPQTKDKDDQAGREEKEVGRQGFFAGTPLLTGKETSGCILDAVHRIRFTSA